MAIRTNTSTDWRKDYYTRPPKIIAERMERMKQQNGGLNYNIIYCHACACALVSLYRNPRPYRPVCCRRSPFWVITDLSCLTGQSAWDSGILHCTRTRWPEWAPTSLIGLYKLQHTLQPARHQETLLDPHAIVLRFAFQLGKRYLFWTRQPRLSRADSHNPTLLRAAHHSWRRARIPSRSLPASATWSRSPWCPPRGTIHFWTLVS